MKKHIFAIFTYFATFFVSFFLVSLLTEKPQMKATSCFPTKNFTTAPLIVSENEQQIEIRNFLEEDQKIGFEYFATNENAENTAKLVENMRSLETADLPVPIRKAYKNHIEAWENFGKHLKRSKNHKDSDKECIGLNRDINETYNILLLAAENQGVDFPN